MSFKLKFHEEILNEIKDMGTSRLASKDYFLSLQADRRKCLKEIKDSDLRAGRLKGAKDNPFSATAPEPSNGREKEGFMSGRANRKFIN